VPSQRSRQHEPEQQRCHTDGNFTWPPPWRSARRFAAGTRPFCAPVSRAAGGGNCTMLVKTGAPRNLMECHAGSLWGGNRRLGGAEIAGRAGAAGARCCRRLYGFGGRGPVPRSAPASTPDRNSPPGLCTRHLSRTTKTAFNAQLGISSRPCRAQDTAVFETIRTIDKLLAVSLMKISNDLRWDEQRARWRGLAEVGVAGLAAGVPASCRGKVQSGGWRKIREP